MKRKKEYLLIDKYEPLAAKHYMRLEKVIKKDKKEPLFSHCAFAVSFLIALLNSRILKEKSK